MVSEIPAQQPGFSRGERPYPGVAVEVPDAGAEGVIAFGVCDVAEHGEDFAAWSTTVTNPTAAAHTTPPPVAIERNVSTSKLPPARPERAYDIYRPDHYEDGAEWPTSEPDEFGVTREEP